MAFNIGELEIRLIADVARLRQDMNKMQTTVSRSTRRINKSVDSSVKAFKSLIGVVGAAGLGRALIRTADTYTKFSAQLKLATNNQADFNQAMKDTRRIAAAAQSDLSSVAVLYARLSNNLKDLKVSQKDIALVTETVALGLKAQGSTAQESASAMLQLSQAFGKGRLDGQELTAMLENAPNVMRAFAKAIDVPFGSLKQLGAEGELTAKKMLEAWTNPELLEAYRKQAKEVRTISGAWQVFKNDLTLIIGEMNDTSDATSEIMGLIESLTSVVAFSADAFVAFIRVVKQLGGSLAVVFKDIQTVFKLMTIETGGAKALNPFGLEGEILRERIKKQYKDILADRRGFMAAAKKDQDAFLGGNYTKFRDMFKVDDAGSEFTPYGGLGVSGAEEKALTEAQLKKLERERRTLEDKRYNKAVEHLDRITEEAIKNYDKRMKAEKERIEKVMAFQQKRANENFKAAQAANERFENERLRYSEKISDNLSRSLTDALYRGFENGKGFVENFIDVLKNSFKTLVLEPIINFLVDSSGITKVLGALGGAFSGNAAAGQAGGQSVTGLLGGIKDTLGSLNGSIVGSIEDLGAFLSTGTGGLGDTIGGFLGQYSNQIADFLPFAGVGLNLLSGNIGGAIGSGIGAALSFTPLGPAGGAIGALIGSALGGVFGGGIPKRNYAEVRSVTESDGSFSSRNTLVERGGYAAVSHVKALSQTFSQSLRALLEGFGADDRFYTYAGFHTRPEHDTDAAFSGGINGRGFHSGALEYDEKDAGAWKRFVNTALGPILAKAIRASSLSDGVKKFFNGLTKKDDVLGAINALTSLNAQLVDLPAVFDAVRNAIDTTAYSTSIDQLKAQFAATQTFVNLFYSDVEKLDIFTNQLTTQFNALNTILPDSRDGFRNLVESINVVDDATRNQYNGLIALAPAMNDYFNALEQQRESLRDIDSRWFSTSANYATAQAQAANSSSYQVDSLGSTRETNAALLDEIRMLREQNIESAENNKILLETIATYTLGQLKIDKKWDNVGLPATQEAA